MGGDAVESRLLQLGASRVEIELARARGRLLSLGIELIVAPGRGLTLAEVASKAGTSYDDALRLWRAWGFPRPDDDDARFTEVDVELLAFALAVEQLVGAEAAYHTARVMGMAVARVAEAEAAMFRAAIEAPLRAAGAGDGDALAAYEQLAPGALDVADRTLASLNRHHLVETARRHVDWDVEASPHNVLDIVVGFADLTGSTRLAAASALEELDHALSVFEERTADVLADAGVTLVKRIGDAVMFTTPAAPLAARVACELVRAFATDPLVPPVRVGLAAGQVVARRGDFYGLPVALAARLQALARPSSVLVDADTARRLRGVGNAHVDAVGTREVGGFPEPVPIFELRVD